MSLNLDLLGSHFVALQLQPAERKGDEGTCRETHAKTAESRRHARVSWRNRGNPERGKTANRENHVLYEWNMLRVRVASEKKKKRTRGRTVEQREKFRSARARAAAAATSAVEKCKTRLAGIRETRSSSSYIRELPLRIRCTTTLYRMACSCACSQTFFFLSRYDSLHPYARFRVE